MAYKRLGDLLITVGLLTDDQLKEALAIQKKEGKKLGAVLIEHGFIKQSDLFKTLERQLGVESIDLTQVVIPKDLIQIVPRTLARKYGIVPVRLQQGNLYVAMDDPLNFIAIEDVKVVSRHKVIPLISTAEQITRAQNDLYGSELADKALEELNSQDRGEQNISSSAAADISSDENAAPTIRLVNSFIEYAVHQNASDIHLEPRERQMVVRMRIDGSLRQCFTVPVSSQSAVVARIKVMGSMNVAEHKIPLDGRANIKVDGTDIDMRISTLPTVFGEKVVIRLLYKSTKLLSYEGIGLSGSNLEKFKRLLTNSNGVILIVGPTGSGKSSSMYTMIKNLNKEEVNLVTLEDPVEYNIDGINQVQINEKTGMTFAGGLRSILRQDPDIVAVGEIRDGETAQIAMRAALTGHLVLSTIHTNDAPSTLDRLRDIGVEDYLTATALKGVISQRLVKRICPACKEAYTPTEQEQEMIRLPYDPNRKFYRGKGCPSCFNTGYKGRTAVFEIMIVTAEIKAAIADNVPHSELIETIKKSDFEPLIADCQRLVLNGTTTLTEAYRTVNTTDA
jgi:type IV pilus assembly protein PilB